MKLLSVIVPVYNAEKWLEETINSILSSTYTNLEVICVDDGSKDNSAEIIKKISEKDSRVKYFLKTNGGVSDARNFGIKKANGEYVAFLDADDIVLPKAYEKMINLLEYEKTDIVFAGFTRFWGEKKREVIEDLLYKLKDNPQDIRYFFEARDGEITEDKIIAHDIHGAVWRSIFKKSIIDKNDIMFPVGITFSEDQIFILNYLLHIENASVLNESVLLYRSWTKKWAYKCFFEESMKLFKLQEDVVLKNPFYSEKEKKRLIGYLKITAFFTTINEELMFKKDAYKIIKEYMKNKEFASYLSFYNMRQKSKVRRDYKRTVLFILLKLRMYKTVQKLFPNKKY